MKVYHYDSKTFEFLYESEAIKDEKSSMLLGKDVWSIPSHSTLVPNHLTKESNKTPIFKNNTWIYIEDYRGVYYDTDGTPLVINELNAPVPNNYSNIPPKLTKDIINSTINVTLNKVSEFITVNDIKFTNNINTKVSVLSLLTILKSKKLKTIEYFDFNKNIIEMDEKNLVAILDQITTIEVKITKIKNNIPRFNTPEELDIFVEKLLKDF